MFKNYKFDIFLGVVGVAACGLASFGILHALQALSFLLKFLGLTFLPAIPVAMIVLVLTAVFLSIRKK